MIHQPSSNQRKIRGGGESFPNPNHSKKPTMYFCCTEPISSGNNHHFQVLGSDGKFTQPPSTPGISSWQSRIPMVGLLNSSKWYLVATKMTVLEQLLGDETPKHHWLGTYKIHPYQKEINLLKASALCICFCHESFGGNVYSMF